MTTPNHLFEVSWEVCNKVGGIYTVLKTKAEQAVHHFNGNYYLIGPYLANTQEFVEDSEQIPLAWRDALATRSLLCHFGYWDIAAKPKVILISYYDQFNITDLLYQYWLDYNIDSYGTGLDYVEPVLFATTAAQVIETIVKLTSQQLTSVAHFHEWITAAGLLYLKKNVANLATVFTTHATVLGRALAGRDYRVNQLPTAFNSFEAARQFDILAKFSLEKTTALYADCFTTVSQTTAEEASILLEKVPDRIVFNGVDLSHQPLIEADKQVVRKHLLTIASQMICRALPEQTRLWVTSGRYEFHNKGFDVLLKSLAKLADKLSTDHQPIVMFFLIAADPQAKPRLILTERLDVSDETLTAKINADLDFDNQQLIAQQPLLTTHYIANEADDPLINECQRLGLNNQQPPIYIIYSSAYLNGDDGVFNYPYEQLLAACDLSLFPSFYEPWGYTPLESLIYHVPTLTTDLAGFANWAASLPLAIQKVVAIISRKFASDSEFVDRLLEWLFQHQSQSLPNPGQRQLAETIVEMADWRHFFQGYLDAYHQALQKIHQYVAPIQQANYEDCTIIQEKPIYSPRLRRCRLDSTLPTEFQRLSEIAANLWWCWHPAAQQLFHELNPKLWRQSKHNPITLLDNLTTRTLKEKAKDEKSVELYQQVLTAFDHDLLPTNAANAYPFPVNQYINEQHPIAYFCMEYGFYDHLLSYAGGLGILAGDYLKTISDLKLPLIAVGLFYKQSYFTQQITATGEQAVCYPSYDPDTLAMVLINDELGATLIVEIELAGRMVYAQVWRMMIGLIPLYLLDTDIYQNHNCDREITQRLYDARHEMRIRQEIILGVGGVRLLEQKLKIMPTLYHLNEGHSAFLLFERMRLFIHQGLTLSEAVEAVRASSLFTTHTPIAAGNEAYSHELFIKYFGQYAASLGVTVEKLFQYGQIPETRAEALFSMTIFALKLTSHANAVSRLHAKVSRSMWNQVWQSFLAHEAPILGITNGVHLLTWVGTHMHQLYDKYLGKEWLVKQQDRKLWEKAAEIPDQQLWQAHQQQKAELIAYISELINQEYVARGEDRDLIQSSLSCLHKDTLFIGFARRFAPYKRHDLIFRDLPRLARILTDKDKPVVILIAGKTHPADQMGMEILAQIFNWLRDAQFNGHIIFLEDYNMSQAGFLVQGVDIWLNNPLLYAEACGTSGMKVAYNGGLHFSIVDGWWQEVYKPELGWKIDSYPDQVDHEKRMQIENMGLLNTLEHEVIPLFYEKNKQGYNPQWLAKMKQSIISIGPVYNTLRMVNDYFHFMYNPAAEYYHHLMADKQLSLKNLTQWKQEVSERIKSVDIQQIVIDGISDDKLRPDGKVDINVSLSPGKLLPEEIAVEFVYGKMIDNEFIDEPKVIPLILSKTRSNGELVYRKKIIIKDSGHYQYGVRVAPQHVSLLRRQEVDMVCWG